MLGPAQPRAAGRAGRRTAAAAAGSLGLLALGLLAGRARAAGKVAPYNELPPPDQWSVEFTCKENTWTDFKKVVSDSVYGNNIIVEVEDMHAQGWAIDAMSLHQFKGKIPSDRHTPIVTDVAIDGIYASGVSYYDLKKTDYFFSVRCKQDDLRFRIKWKLIASTLVQEQKQSGEVCPGLWSYHKIKVDKATVPASAKPAGGKTHLKLKVEVKDWSVTAITAADYVPLKLVPPFAQVKAPDCAKSSTCASPADELGSKTIELCDVHDGHLYYLGLLGTDHCAEYSVTASYFTDTADHSCHALHHAGDAAKNGATEVEAEHFLLRDAEAGEIHDFFLTVDAKHKDDNIVVEVENLSEEEEPESMIVKLFHKEIPVDREAEHLAAFGVHNIFSVAKSAHDVKEGTYYISVEAKKAVKFRVLAMFIHAEMKPGDHSHGEVCPGNMVFHYYQKGDAGAGGHRRRLQGAAPGGGAGKDYRFRVVLHVGDVRYMEAHLHPPLELIPPYRTALTSDPAADHPHADVCRDAHDGKHYIALFGGTECANYEIYLEEIPAGDTCKALKHECAGECEDALCTDVELDHFQYGSCVPGGWQDYKLEVTAANSDNNLLFMVEDLTGNRRPDALGLYHYSNPAGGAWEIPLDRSETERYSDYSTELKWSIAISKHDLKTGTHYFAVKCGPEPVQFRVLAQLAHAGMKHDETVHTSVCPGSWVYHYISVGDDYGGHRRALAGAGPPAPAKNYGHAHFDIYLHSGDMDVLTRHGHPPLKHTSYKAQALSGKHMKVSLCNLEPGRHYVGLRGGHHCASACDCHNDYEINMVHDPDANHACEELKDSHKRAPGGSNNLEFDHFTPGSCEPGEYVDYKFKITCEQAESNLVIELEDVSGTDDPEALTLLLYEGEEAPADRVTELFAARASDHMYSVAVNSWDIHPDDYIVSVKYGAEPKRFRLLAELIKSEVKDRGHVAGVVCPGEFIYHHHTFGDHAYSNCASGGGGGAKGAGAAHRLLQAAAAAGDSAVNVKFRLELHSGDLFYVTRHGHPPLKLLPPYAKGSYYENGGTYEINICNMEEGHHFLGLLGGYHCAEYDLYAETFTGGECAEIEHKGYKSKPKELKMDHFHLDHCEAGAFRFFKIHVDAKDADANLLIETEALSDATTPDALTTYLYPGQIPLDLKTQYLDDFSAERIWTLSVNKHELHEGDYYVGVKCGAAKVNFRILPLLVKAHLYDGHSQHGEVCPGDWVHHYFELPPEMTSAGVGGHGAAGGGHRKALAAVGAPGRQLQAKVGTNIKFKIDIHTGDTYLMTRPSKPPIKLSPPYNYAVENESGHAYYEVHICHVEKYTARKHYLSLLGAYHCADYDVTATVYTGDDDNCAKKQLAHDMSLVRNAPQRLEAGHFFYATCQPHEYQDYVITLDAEAAKSNFIFFAEDVREMISTRSLKVSLYKGSDGIPIDRKADDASTVGAGNKYSLAMDYIDLQPGTYHLSVQCQDDAVKYRTAVTLVAAELHEYDTKIGNVSPEQWTFHKFSFTGSHEPHLKFKFRVFSGNVFAVFAREEKPPGFATPASNHYTKVIEPAEQVQHKGEEILFCNASDRVKYIGIFGGDLAAEYEITADAYSGECSEEGDAYVAAAGRGNGAWRGGRVGGAVIAALALVVGLLL